MLSLRDIKFVCNDQQDYIRRLERAYEQQQKEIERLNTLYGAYNKETKVTQKLQEIMEQVAKELEKQS
jgi:hypothetical protein